jgi:hypothetical protein
MKSRNDYPVLQPRRIVEIIAALSCYGADEQNMIIVSYCAFSLSNT